LVGADLAVRPLEVTSKALVTTGIAAVRCVVLYLVTGAGLISFRPS
jgi:hypothetical protein